MPLDHPEDKKMEASTVRWMRWGAILLLGFAAAFPIYRAVEPRGRAEAQEQRAVNLAALGTDMYSKNCSQCHGIEAGGGLAPALKSKQFLQSVTDDQLSQLIAVGIPGSPMAAYSIDFGGSLTQEQIEAIAVYLRSLESEAPDFPGWRYPLAEEGLSGEDLFNMACATCHGLDLQGGEVAPDLGPGSDAEEESDDRLILRITNGKDEMPAFGGTLDETQIQSIVEYLREVQQGG
jgi:cytochrome c oxidase cbb3-type subunit III